MAFASSAAMFAQHASGVDWKGHDWMSYLDDDALVSQLSLPGAHDAATAEGWVALSIVPGNTNSVAQDVKVNVQYNNGVRVFDIRPYLFSGTLYNSHGITRIEKTIEKLLDEMIAFLDAHPTEFFVFHVYHGGSGWDAKTANAFGNLLAKSKYAGRVAQFRNTLTVGEMRGKLLFLSREEASGDTKWPGGFLRGWDEHGYENNKHGYVNVGSMDDYAYNAGAASIYIQDMAGTAGKVPEKMESLRRLLDFTTHHNVRLPGQAIWTFNFASACAQMSPLNISLSDGYRDNATYTNKCILDYLTAPDYKPGPTGMMMIDYVCVETTTFNDKKYMTNGNNVYGQQVVDAIIDNNFRCSADQLKMPAFSNTLPLTFSNEADLTFDENENENANRPGGLPLAAYSFGAKRLDFNQDGLVDYLFPSNTHDGLLLMKNNGDGTFTPIADEALRSLEHRTSDGYVKYNAGHKATMLSVGDYDNDGYPDLAVQSHGDNVGRYVKVFRNRQGEGFEEVQTVAQVSEGGVSFADFNADGLLDLVTAGYGDGPELRFFRGTSNAATPFTDITDDVARACGFRNTKDFRNAYGAYESGLLAFDYNQDGRQDIYINGSSQNTNNKLSAALINTTKPGADVFSFDYLASGITPFSWAGNRVFSIVDLNGDDCVDAVMQGWSSEGRNWTYAVSHSNGAADSYTSTLFGDGRNSGIGGVFTEDGKTSFGDYNGDGLLDLAVGSSENTEVYYNTTANSVQAPSAPTNVKAGRDDDGNITVTWNASTLAHSGGKAMYNVYLKDNVSGKVRMLVPAVTATGQQTGYAEFAGYFVSPDAQPSYTFKAMPEGDYTVGVQAVSYNYAASAFATADVATYGVPAAVVGYDGETEKYYGTYYADYAWAVPEGYTAYTVSAVADGAVVLTAVTGGVVPSHTGAILCGDAPCPEVMIEKATLAGSYAGTNLLSGTTTDTTISDADSYIYKLSLCEDGTRLGFFFDSLDGHSLAAKAYKAYLKVAADALSPSRLQLRFDDLLTGLSPMFATPQSQATYNLQGQPSKSGTNGLLIQNGKVIVK